MRETGVKIKDAAITMSEQDQFIREEAGEVFYFVKGLLAKISRERLSLEKAYQQAIQIKSSREHISSWTRARNFIHDNPEKFDLNNH